MTGFDHKSLLATMTCHAGVYQMFDANHALLYVGKAKNLKKRVGSYFGNKPQSARTRALVRQVCAVQVTVTRTEAEALLLESNLIKQHRPRYNVLLRDDKSYPYLRLSAAAYPRLSFYRGPTSGGGRCFGPYPSARAARRALNLVQKLFKIRPCDEHFFRNRSRPCLQYQIKRCTAPCVGLVEAGQYQEDVRHATLFLEGRNEEVVEALTAPMQQAAAALDYERAAQYRDQLVSLRKIQESQYITAPRGELDVVACKAQEGVACVQVFSVRGGLNLGNRAFFPNHARELDEGQVLNAFMSRYYLEKVRGEQVPAEILVSRPIADAQALMSVLSERRGRRVSIKRPHRGERRKWLEMALNNAEIALKTRLSSREKHAARLAALQAALRAPAPFERIECFDVSHSSGEATVASCVVFDRQGAVKSDYRRFNIKGAASGDDYAALTQAFTRRYARIKQEDGKLPDLVLIDGGKGQVGSVMALAEELQLDDALIIGVAKGRARKPGQEKLVFSDGEKPLQLAPDAPALHLVQEIRDEAHRFAITGHRRRRDQRRRKSVLEEVPGIGAKRRRELIRFFGGIQGVTGAGEEELARAPGINRRLAGRIYAALHGEKI